MVSTPPCGRLPTGDSPVSAGDKPMCAPPGDTPVCAPPGDIPMCAPPEKLASGASGARIICWTLGKFSSLNDNKSKGNFLIPLFRSPKTREIH